MNPLEKEAYFLLWYSRIGEKEKLISSWVFSFQIYIVNLVSGIIATATLNLWAQISQNGETLKQFIGKLPTNCLSVFDHFVGQALKGLNL